jgi:all-beta uncharacterized protein
VRGDSRPRFANAPQFLRGNRLTLALVLSIGVADALVGCTSDHSPGPTTCVMALDSPGQAFAAAGGTAHITATIARGCAWSAVSDAAWVRVTSGSTGNGSGVVTFVVDANIATDSRGATIRIADQIFQVSQQAAAPASCVYAITPARSVVPSRSTAFDVQVVTPFGCRWEFAGNDSWIHVEPQSDGAPNGNGNGTVTATIAGNGSAGSRTGTATIAGQTVTVLQDGQVQPACSYVVAPTQLEFESVGGNGQFELTTDTACGWHVLTGGPDPSVVQSIVNAEGFGNAVVRYAVPPNPSKSPRRGSVLVQGRTGLGQAEHDVLQKAP